MIKQFVRIAATAALATWAIRSWLDASRASNDSADGKPVKVKPKAVETWEGEGGTILPPRRAAETSAQTR